MMMLMSKLTCREFLSSSEMVVRTVSTAVIDIWGSAMLPFHETKLPSCILKSFSEMMGGLYRTIDIRIV